MSVVETNKKIDQPRTSAFQKLGAVVFFAAAGLATVGWIAFLVWIALAFCGF